MNLFRVFVCSTLLALLICCAILAAGCGHKAASPETPQPPETVLHKLDTAAYQIANGLNSGEKEFENLYSAGIPGLSDDDYAKEVAGIFLDAINANDEFIANLKTLQAVDPSNKQQVVHWVANMRTSVDRLLNEGVLHIKNPEARAAVVQALQLVPPGELEIEAALALVPDVFSSIAADHTAGLIPEVKHGSFDSRTDRAARRSVARVDRNDDGVHSQTEGSQWADKRSAFDGWRRP